MSPQWLVRAVSARGLTLCAWVVPFPTVPQIKMSPAEPECGRARATLP